nr:TPA_asm: ND4L [Bombus soroeensis]
MKLYNMKLIMFLILNLIILVICVLLNHGVYFLSFLIGMEYMIVMILFYLMVLNYNNWFYLIYLVYSVCEGVLGLSLLVSMNYEFGHQKINFINLF